MAYGARRGAHPFEHASRASHSQVINDPSVTALLDRCYLPRSGDGVSESTDDCDEVPRGSGKQIEHIVTVDGGYTEVTVRAEYPSAKMAFFQFGILAFAVQDLEKLEKKRFIDPDDMEKLNGLERLRLSVPSRAMCIEGASSLTHSVRVILDEFLDTKLADGTLNDTLLWLVFRRFTGSPVPWSLAQCPHCASPNVQLTYSAFADGHSCECPECAGTILPVDILRLHEAIDDELGASGIFGYLTNAIEQILIIHFIRTVKSVKPAFLSKILFLKDGPLAYFGQTANLHAPTRELILWLEDHTGINLCGLEKSGAFVEHADEVIGNIPLGGYRVLTDQYIYRNIIPGTPDPRRPYGSSTYYSDKILFHSRQGRAYVVTVPNRKAIGDPNAKNLINPLSVLDVVSQLGCDMYDNSLVPIALANKLVSLADHPSQRILQRFASETVTS